MGVADVSLSLRQQRIGRRKLLIFSFVNGVSIILISGNILSLFLLKIDIPAYMVAIISSFSYLASVSTIFSKWSIVKWGAGNTIKISWFLRSIFIIFLASIPFLVNDVSHSYIIVLIFIFSFLYFVCKDLGIPAIQPVIADITDNENSGTFSSSYYFSFSIAVFIAMVVACLLIFYRPGLQMFQLFLICGSLCGIACCFILSGMKESPIPKASAAQLKFKSVLSEILKDDDIRNFLFVKAFTFSLCSVIASVSIIAFVKIYDLPYSFAVFFAVIQLSGGIAISYFSGLLTQYSGPKPLITLYVVILMIISLMWVVAPAECNYFYMGILFFLCGFSSRGLSASLLHYFLIIIPKEKNVGFSIVFSLMNGIIVGIAGVFIGGGLLKLLNDVGFQHAEMFKIYYFIMILLCVPVLLMMERIKDVKGWNLKDLFDVMFSPKDFHALLFLHKIKKYDDIQSELNNIEILGSLNSELSESKILYYLDSPSYIMKMNALRALTKIQITDKAKGIILRELEAGEYTTGYIAAGLAGNKQIIEAIPLLRKYIYSEDYYLKVNSIVALATLKDYESYIKIIDIFKESENPRVLIHTSFALSQMDNKNLVGILLSKLHNLKQHNSIASSEILIAVSTLLDSRDTFYKFLRVYIDNEKNAIQWLSEGLENVSSYKYEKYDSRRPAVVLKDFVANTISKADIIEYILKFKHFEYKEIPFVFFDFIEESNVNELRTSVIYLAFVVLFR